MTGEIIPLEQISSKILLIRGQKVMLDRDLAELYGVDTKRLNEQVTRNIKRFPEDFMFELKHEEVNNLLSQFVIPSMKVLGGAIPMAFTEHSVAILSSVLKSEQAK
ncbi:MAG: hypothetical protein MAG581_02195 [Deltaproteobacteria bacterium]|jgi:hypothetical protein|nr:hypothetical protein [Deltaproteobacteria bacterium]